MNKEVDGVAVGLLVGPPPKAVLDDETGMVKHLEVTRTGLAEAKASVGQQRSERDAPGSADLLFGPCRAFSLGCNNLSSNVAGLRPD